MNHQRQNRTNLVQSFLQGVWESRWDVCLPILSEKAIYEDPLLDSPVLGRDAIIDTFKLCHAWGDLKPVLKNVFGDDRMVAAEFQVKGNVKAAMLGIPESAVGKSFDFAECDVFEFNDRNLIARMTIYADVAGFLKQLGMR